MEDNAECMLVLIGATPEGKKELVGFQTGVRESAQSWRELLIDIKQRGLEIAPDLAIGDGALGFWKAIEEVFPSNPTALVPGVNAAAKTWRRLKGESQLPKVVQGVKFKDGIEVTSALGRIRVAPARARAGKARRPPFRPCHANARCSSLGRGHQYACGPLPSRSKLQPHNALGNPRCASMSR